MLNSSQAGDSGHVGSIDRDGGMAPGSGSATSLGRADSDRGDLLFALALGQQPSEASVTMHEM